ncbi:MAG: hypothetical protein J3K34DRAFT_520340 [Monoraphidium minutum]|nr:MAG: hypothetical protein J3K34DRAFT_520340 [Monoraphidium minutum]
MRQRQPRAAARAAAWPLQRGPCLAQRRGSRVAVAAQLSSQQKQKQQQQQQREQEPVSVPSAEERLHMQLRALPTVTAEALALAAVTAPEEARAAAAAAAAAAGAAPQQQGRLGALLARLPKFDGRLRGLVLLNLMTVAMGSNWVVVKASAEGATMTDSTVFMALRFALAAALFVPFLKPGDKAITKAGLQIGVFYALGYITQAVALAHTAASRASLLSTFTVLTVPMIAGLCGERIRPIVWVCAAAALAGTGMLEGGSDLGPPNVGDAWAVASALCFGLQMFLTERHMHNLPKGSELPLMGVSMVTVAALAGAAAVGMHAGDLPSTAAGVGHLFAEWQALLPAALGGGGSAGAAEATEAARTFQQLFYTAVVSTDLVLFAELVALQDVSSTDAAMIYSLEPVAGALMAYAFLGERWGLWGWVGGATILGASMLTQVGGAADKEGGGGGGGGEGGAAPAAPAAVAAELVAAGGAAGGRE